MKLIDIQNKVYSSNDSDWNVMDINTVYSWEYGTQNGQNYIEPIMHNKLAVLENSVEISIAFGAPINDNYQESWCKLFPDPSSKSVSVDIRYNGEVVASSIFIIVDGGRYIVPLPEIQSHTFQISSSAIPFAELIFNLYGSHGVHKTLDEVLSFANINIV